MNFSPGRKPQVASNQSFGMGYNNSGMSNRSNNENMREVSPHSMHTGGKYAAQMKKFTKDSTATRNNDFGQHDDGGGHETGFHSNNGRVSETGAGGIRNKSRNPSPERERGGRGTGGGGGPNAWKNAFKVKATIDNKLNVIEANEVLINKTASFNKKELEIAVQQHSLQFDRDNQLFEHDRAKMQKDINQLRHKKEQVTTALMNPSEADLESLSKIIAEIFASEEKMYEVVYDFMKDRASLMHRLSESNAAVDMLLQSFNQIEHQHSEAMANMEKKLVEKKEPEIDPRIKEELANERRRREELESHEQEYKKELLVLYGEVDETKKELIEQLKIVSEEREKMTTEKLTMEEEKTQMIEYIKTLEEKVSNLELRGFREFQNKAKTGSGQQLQYIDEVQGGYDDERGQSGTIVKGKNTKDRKSQEMSFQPGNSKNSMKGVYDEGGDEDKLSQIRSLISNIKTDHDNYLKSKYGKNGPPPQGQKSAGGNSQSGKPGRNSLGSGQGDPEHDGHSLQQEHAFVDYNDSDNRHH